MYEAYDTFSNTNVVLKETIGKLGKVATSSQMEAMKAAFIGGAKVLTEIKHESLVSVQDYFSEIDRQYLVLESVVGFDLTKFLKPGEQRPALSDVLSWADQLLDALNYLHNLPSPIIHRDIRPENVKLTANLKAKLLTAGISANAGPDSVTSVPTQATEDKSLHFRPLEQLWDGLDNTSQRVILNRYDEKSERILLKPLNAASDLYSLGATLYCVMTGLLPNDALERSIAVLEGKPDPLREPAEINGEIPPEVSELIVKAMAIRREDRFDSAVIFRQVIKTARVRIEERKAEEEIGDSNFNGSDDELLELKTEKSSERGEVIDGNDVASDLDIQETESAEIQLERDRRKAEERQLELEAEQARLEEERERLEQRRLELDVEKERQRVERERLEREAAEERKRIEKERIAKLAEDERLRAAEKIAELDAAQALQRAEEERLALEAEEERTRAEKKLRELESEQERLELEAENERKRAELRLQEIQTEQDYYRAEQERIKVEAETERKRAEQRLLELSGFDLDIEPHEGRVHSDLDEDKTLLELEPTQSPLETKDNFADASRSISNSESSIFNFAEHDNTDTAKAKWHLPAVAAAVVLLLVVVIAAWKLMSSGSAETAPAASIQPSTVQSAESIPASTSDIQSSTNQSPTSESEPLTVATDPNTHADVKIKQPQLNAAQEKQRKQLAPAPAKTPAPKKAVTVDDLIHDN